MSHKADASFFDAKRPWSKYKDTILGYYLKPYLAKVQRLNRPILLVDLFAGAGRFGDGSDGSPLILLKAAAPVADQGHKVRVLLAEQDPVLVSRLRANTTAYATLADIRHADCLDLLPEIAVEARRSTVLLYVDPFTLKGLHLGKLAKVFSSLQAGSSVELLFVFMGPVFLRWAKWCIKAEDRGQEALGDKLVVDENGDFDRMMADALWDQDTVRAAMQARASEEQLDAIAGGDYWRIFAQKELTPELHDEFTARYCDELRRWFQVVCRFPIFTDENAQVPKYWIIFGTRYRPALDLINRAMAKAREEQAQQWGATSLFAGSDLSNLTRRPLLKPIILDHARSGVVSWQNLRLDVTERYLGFYTDSEINNEIKSLLQNGYLTGASGQKVENGAVLRLVSDHRMG